MTSLDKGVTSRRNLFVLAIDGPTCNCIINVVAIDKFLICYSTVRQAVGAFNILHIQVRTILIDSGQRSGEDTHLALVEFIQLIDADNGRGRLGTRFTVELDGQNLINITVSGYDAIYVVGISIGGSGHTKGVGEVSAAAAIGSSERATVTIRCSNHALEQHIVCPMSLVNLAGGDDLSIYMDIASSSLESLRTLQLRLAVIGRLGAAKASRNDITNLVGMTRALINETKTSLILAIHGRAGLPQNGAGIGERYVGIVIGIEHITPTKAGSLGKLISCANHAAHLAILLRDSLYNN